MPTNRGKVFSVGQVNAYIHGLFVSDYLLRNLCVRGEVSNLKYHSSGHIYFTLKDASGTLSCIMFAGSVSRGLSFRMREGDEVLATGSVSVWERGGTYQLYATRIEKAGVGLLNEKYEALKKKLEEMGLFSEVYKQRIPKYIKRLGVVTAPTGAAIHDIINVATRRNPFVEIILYPALVQGEGAKESVCRGIRALDSLGDNNPSEKIDVILIGRGGGSLEDLWAFNEEEVAQAVFDCRTPIISAVGHETDTVITDYVADLRAPTPSAGAELAVFDVSQYLRDVSGMGEKLTAPMTGRLLRAKDLVQGYQNRVAAFSPKTRLAGEKTQLVRSFERLDALMQAKLLSAKQELLVEDRIQQAMERKLTERSHALQLYAQRLDGVSPLKRLSGGYAFVEDHTGRALTHAGDAAPGDLLSIHLRDGKILARTEEVVPEKRGQGQKS